MSPRLPSILFVAFIVTQTGAMADRALAVTVEVAKKCDQLVAKAFPPRVPGNPAAGLAKGTPQEQRDYFRKCIENGGNMDNSADDKNQKN